MSVADWIAAFIMVWATALILTGLQRVRFGLHQRIRQKLGQSPTVAASPPPFLRAFTLNLLFLIVVCAAALATIQFIRSN